MGRLLSDEDGVKTIAHIEDGDLTIQRHFNNKPVLDELARIRSVSDGRGKDGYYVGSLPMGIVEEYMNRKGINFHQFLNEPMHVRALMNDPDYADLRIWKGRL